LSSFLPVAHLQIRQVSLMLRKRRDGGNEESGAEAFAKIDFRRLSTARSGDAAIGPRPIYRDFARSVRWRGGGSRPGAEREATGGEAALLHGGLARRPRHQVAYGVGRASAFPTYPEESAEIAVVPQKGAATAPEPPESLAVVGLSGAEFR